MDLFCSGDCGLQAYCLKNCVISNSRRRSASHDAYLHGDAIGALFAATVVNTDALFTTTQSR